MTIKPPCTDFAVKGKKAKLLGFPTFAHWNLSNKMAKTPERTMELMMSVWEPAVAQVHKDVASMQKIVDAEEEILKFLLGIIVIIRRKFEKKNTIWTRMWSRIPAIGMLFWVAGELFDLQFKQITNVPVYHADVRVWEVSNKTTGN
jgi:peptidyl-dipeptidase Dcp